MQIEINENVILAPYTIYKIGGPANFFAEVKSASDLEQALEFVSLNRVFFILGAGSNVLVSDKGFDGLVIRLNGGGIRVDEERVVADAGVMMPRAVLETVKNGFTGFEWGIGIPGTIGGSVRGNAGCFGGEMKDAIESVEVFDSIHNTKYTIQNTECEFAYRDSIFKHRSELVILSATLKLPKGDPRFIQENIKKIIAERVEKQDIGAKSCGCIFKNVPWDRKDIKKEKLLKKFPELEKFSVHPNIPASYLIDWSYLKGTQMGRVYVSPKHANYFVNEGGATAEEIIILISLVKDTVRRKYGILLEEEIQYIGF